MKLLISETSFSQVLMADFKRKRCVRRLGYVSFVKDILYHFGCKHIQNTLLSDAILKINYSISLNQGHVLLKVRSGYILCP